MTKSDITSKFGSSGWHIALGKASSATGDKPYLGDPLTVDSLLRSFVKDICDRFAEVSEGGMFAQDAAAEDKEACEAIGRAFAGEDEGFVTVGQWNGDGVVAFCRKAMPDYLPEGGSNVETMTQVMAVLVHEVYDVLRDASEDGEAEMAGEALNGKIEDWSRMLLGLPPEDD